jgi:hypothetical protein
MDYYLRFRPASIRKCAAADCGVFYIYTGKGHRGRGAACEIAAILRNSGGGGRA